MSEKQKEMAKHIFDYLVETGTLKYAGNIAHRYNVSTYSLQTTSERGLMNVLVSAVSDYESKQIRRIFTKLKAFVTTSKVEDEIVEKMTEIKNIFAARDPEDYGEMVEASDMANRYWSTLAEYPWLKEMGFNEDDVSDPKNN